jgi:hypothetical protein
MFLTIRLVALVSHVWYQRRIRVSQWAMVRARRSSSGTSLAWRSRTRRPASGGPREHWRRGRCRAVAPWQVGGADFAFGVAGGAQRHSRLAHTAPPADRRSAVPHYHTAASVAGRPHVAGRAPGPLLGCLHCLPPLARRPSSSCRARRTRPARAAPTRHYRRDPSGASSRCSRWAAASMARPLTVHADRQTLNQQPTRPRTSSWRAF